MFWTKEISSEISGKIWLMIILKVTKKHGFTLSLGNTFLKRPQGRDSNWHAPQAILGLKHPLKNTGINLK